MEKLTIKVNSFNNALKTLQDILKEDLSTIVRDATIQRFEYTFEAMWKAAKQFLLEEEGLDVNSPKSCFRAMFKSGLLDEDETETAIRMTDDRNLTSHTYIEAVAQQIHSRIPEYVSLMDKVADRLNNKE